MTSHLPDYEARVSGRDGLAVIREDIHVHTSSPQAQRRLADPSTFDEWLSPQFRDFAADSEGCAFTLALPMRNEPARLRRDPLSNGTIRYVRDGSSAVDSIEWALHVEGAREVHVTVDVAYRPAGGLLGAIREVLWHRGHRAQAFRDALWNLKHVLEMDAAESPGAPA